MSVNVWYKCCRLDGVYVGRFEITEPEMPESFDRFPALSSCEPLRIALGAANIWDLGFLDSTFDWNQMDVWLGGRLVALLTREAQPEEKAQSGGCPECGDVGKFVRMSLVCPTHGFFGGL